MAFLCERENYINAICFVFFEMLLYLKKYKLDPTFYE